MIHVSPGSFSDLQEAAARMPALLRLLQGNGILTASGLISKATAKHQKVRKRERILCVCWRGGLYGPVYPLIGQRRPMKGNFVELYRVAGVGEVMALGSMVLFDLRTCSQLPLELIAEATSPAAESHSKGPGAERRPSPCSTKRRRGRTTTGAPRLASP